jgi:alanine racemase
LALITLSQSNYYHNLDQVLKKVESKDQIAVVLKDNGYGHGLVQVAQMANRYGVKTAVVRRVSEAQQIAELFSSIIILAPEKVVENRKFSYTVNSLSDLEKFDSRVNIELKVDTGMHRLGVGIDEVGRALDRVQQMGLNLKGVFTHYREADELSSAYYWQKSRFNEVKEAVKKRGFSVRFHSSNSAGTFRNSEPLRDELVRVGIASYGYLPVDKSLNPPELKPVLNLYGDRLGFKEAVKGQRIGYGGESTIESEDSVGIYDVGYGDGFRRLPVEAIKNRKFRTPDGSYLLGRVSMDSIALNSRRNRVLLLDSVTDFAKLSGTFEYEILVNLSADIERVIVE